MRLDPHQQDYMKLLAFQREASNRLMDLYARVNAGTLRGKTVDRIGDLLDRIKAESGP